MKGALVMGVLILGWAAENNGSDAGDSKIVGGMEIPDIREMPYIVAISAVVSTCNVSQESPKEETCESTWYFTCAGTLLSPTFVMTACHCFAEFKDINGPKPALPTNISLNDWRFVAGSRRLNPRDSTAQIRTPSLVLFHPKCARIDPLAVYDLGLGKMDEPFAMNEFVRPARLFSLDPNKFKVNFAARLRKAPVCYVSGWGSTTQEKIDLATGDVTGSPSGSITVSTVLKTARMNVLTHQQCLQRFKDRIPNNELDEKSMDFEKYNQICIASPIGHEGFCSGDSGGPFVCDGYFVALVSNSIECGTALPQICQEVMVLLDWLHNDVCVKYNCSDIYKTEPKKKQLRVTGSSTAGSTRCIGALLMLYVLIKIVA